MTRTTAIRSPVFALLWEIWTVRRFGFVVLGAFIPICTLSARLLALPQQNELWTQIARLPFGCSLVAIFLFFSFTESSRSENVAVFPVRLFALPVRTLTLVAVPMLSGAAVAALLYVLWAKLVFAPLEQDTPVVVPALMLSAGLMSHLAIMWGLPRLRLGRLLLSGVLGVVLIWGLVFPDALLPPWLANASPITQVVVKSTVLAMIGTAAFCSALISVARQRHVRTRGSRPTPNVNAATAGSAQALPPFSSPALAQLWLEWRRHGWFLTATVLALGLVAAGPISLVVGLDPVNSLKLAGWLLVVPLAMATLLGKALAVPDFWSRELILPPFIAIRPQSSAEIVFSRFRMAAISAALSWLVLGSCLLAALGLWGDSSLLRAHWQEFRQSHTMVVQGLVLALGIISLFLLTWRQLSISLYLGLYGRAGLFAATVILSFGLYFVVLPWVVNWVLVRGFSNCEPLVPWRMVIALITGLFMAKIFLACWIWSALGRRQLVPIRQVAGYWLLWCLGTACLVTEAELALPGFAWVRHGVAMLCLLVLPLVRPGLAVIALTANRHRVSSATALRSPTFNRPSRRTGEIAQLNLSPPKGAIPSRGAIYDALHSPVFLTGLAVPALALSILALSVASVLWRGVPHQVRALDGQLRLLQLGNGSPTVVLESDLLGLIENWWPVQRELAQITRVVAYERTGRGGSSATPSAASAALAMRQLHAALLQARALPPFLLVGDGLGCSLVRVFASLYPKEVAGLVLLDPPQIETSTEALAWLRANRPEQLAEILDSLKVYPVEVHGYGIREFKKAEVKLGKLAPDAREKARVILWDEVTDGTLYGMGIHVGHMPPGAVSEFAAMDSIILEDRAAWPLPGVPLAVVTGLKRGILTTIERDSLDEDAANQKLARNSEWVSRVPGATHVITLESGGSIPADQPDLVVETVKSTLRRIAAPPLDHKSRD